METTMNNIHPDTTAPAAEAQQNSAASRPAGRPDDVVRRSEFHLALWMGGFALTAMLGGFTFLYTAIMDMRVEMEAQFGRMRVEMEAQRVEMQEQHVAIKDELRAEMRAEHDKIRSDIGSDIEGLRGAVIDVRERVIRIEAHLGIAAAPDEEPADEPSS